MRCCLPHLEGAHGRGVPLICVWTGPEQDPAQRTPQLAPIVTKSFTPQIQKPETGEQPQYFDTTASLWSLHQLKTRSFLMENRPAFGPDTDHRSGALPSKSSVSFWLPLPWQDPPSPSASRASPQDPGILSPVGRCFFLLSTTTHASPMTKSV